MSRVGRPSTDHRSICLYSEDEDAPQCTERAVAHLEVEDATYGLVGLATCGQHLSIARRAGRLIAVHTIGLYCGLPGTLWTDAGCVLDVVGGDGMTVPEIPAS